MRSSNIIENSIVERSIVRVVTSIFSIITLLGIYSCEEVIDLKVGDDESRIVIEANVINDTTNGAVVSLSRSKSFYSEDTVEVVTGATVTITEDGKEPITLEEASEGQYLTRELIAQPLSSYKLEVISESNRYEATTSMPKPIEIDSISYRWEEFSPWEIDDDDEITEGIRLIVHFEDPAEDINFIRFIVNVNDTKSKTFLYDDQFFNGNSVSYDFYGLTSLEEGDVVEVELWSIPEETHKFYETSENVIIEESGGGSSMGSTPPDNPFTNLSNEALGYFSASTISRSTVIIESISQQ